MVQSKATSDSKLDAPQFPGPRILSSSWVKWGKITLGSALFTALGIFMILKAAPYGTFATATFGTFTIVGVGMLLPGASSLRLDEEGFETIKFFVFRQRYRWRDVSDFVVFTVSRNSCVVFKAEKPHLGGYERISAALTGGRNGYLPDTYGMDAYDLAKLMMSWRNSALIAIK